MIASFERGDALVEDLALGDVARIAGVELDLLLGDDVGKADAARRAGTMSAGNDELALEVALGLEAHALGAQAPRAA